MTAHRDRPEDRVEEVARCPIVVSLRTRRPVAPDMDPLVAVGAIVVFVGVMYLKRRSRRALRPDGWHLPFPLYLGIVVLLAGVLFYFRSTG